MTKSVISRDSNILGGTPTFSGTRVPIRILLEHFEAGDTLDDFLSDYPTVSRKQAVALLELVIARLGDMGDEAVA